MSLQLWLPLNGNLNNQGIGSTTITNNGATIDSNGKIGKCYSFDGSDDYISLTSSAIYSTFAGGSTPFSIAFWVYHADSTRAIIFGDYQLSGSISFNVELTTSHLVRFYWGGSPDKTFTNSSVELNTWTHICITYDGSELLMYKNGNVLSDSYTGVLTAKSKTSGSFYLGRDSRTGTTALNGKLNDFRIYDHCLSPKEIKEINKGLVLHYPLDSVYNTNLVNKYSGESFLGLVDGQAHFVRTKLSNEVGYNYKLNYVGNGSNVWEFVRFGYFSFTPDKIHQYSIYVRCNSKSNVGFTFRAARVVNDYMGCATVNVDNADGKWHRYELSQLIPSTFTNNGTTYTSNPLIEFYIGNLSGSGVTYSLDIDLKFAQVVESDVKVPVIDNSMMSNKVYDCSGYGNDGTVGGTLSINPDSSRYGSSTVFNGSDSLIDVPIKPMSNFTISSWFNRSNEGQYITYYAAKDTYSTWICLENSRYFMYDSNGSAHVGTYTSVKDAWQHIALVYNGSYLKLYINGSFISQISNNTLYSSNVLNIGGRQGNSSYGGKMSDFRIYATALSADDIKELYNTPAFLTDNGTMEAYEFNESESGVDIKKNGIVEAPTLYETNTSLPSDVSLGTEKARIGENYITSNRIIEI